MVSIFTVKKQGALLLMAFLPVFGLVAGFLVTNDITYGLIGVVGGIGIAFVLANFILLRDPFLEMIEKQGLLTAVLDSTGVVKHYNTYVKQDQTMTKAGKEIIEDVFDRQNVFTMYPPTNTNNAIIEPVPNSDELIIRINRRDVAKYVWMMKGRPLMIYNEQIGAFLDKHTIGKAEADYFSQHQVLLLNKRIHDIANNLRDYHRYVVELFKPKKGLFDSMGWLWIVVIFIAIIIIAALGWPIIEKLLTGVSGASSQAITPR